MYILAALLVLLCAAGVSADATYKRGSGGGGSGLATYSETRSPVAGSDPCDTGDTWFNETDHTYWFCEDGATDAWRPAETRVASIAITDGVTISTAEDAFIFRVPTAETVLHVGCITIGGTSADATVQECDSTGANCTTTEAVLTCDSNGDGTTLIDDANLDAGDLVRLSIGIVTGTVTSLSVYVTRTPR